MIRKQCLTCRRIYARDASQCPDDGAALATILVDSLVGTKLSDKYDILEELGRGGMGVVYKAKQSGLDRIVAIKMLLSDIGEDETSVKRFESEAKACSSMNHPNVIKVLDFAVSEMGTPYIVMDYHCGQSLQDVLKLQHRLPLERAMPIFIQICDALSHAHRRGVVHRDLKGSNIMLVEADEVLDHVILLDFGIAKLFTAPGKAAMRLTKTGEVMGSPLYMSPEQCMGQTLDNRSDIYSLGCLMYETITGVPPISGDSFLNVVFKHVNEDPAPIEEAQQDLSIPSQLSQAVMKCLNKPPHERYESAAELRRDLIKVIEVQSKGDDVENTVVNVIGMDQLKESENRYFEDLKKDAENGDAERQFDLSWYYRLGDGAAFKEDLPMAFYWMAKSAGQGFRQAQFDLGWMYVSGIGCEQDQSEGFKWYQKAAQQGHDEGQNELGLCYLHGLGVEKDADLALYWFQKSTAQGWVAAQTSIGFMYEQGLIDGETNFELAAEWYTRAAEQGDPYAQFYIGKFYMLGQGVAKDHSKAVEWFKLSAKHPVSDAQFELALCYRDGLGVQVNQDKFQQLLEAAAEQNHAEAALALGLFYYEKREKALSYLENAVKWLEIAGEAGHTEAMEMYFECRKELKKRRGNA